MFSSLVTVFASAALASAIGMCARDAYKIQVGDYCDLIAAAHNSTTYQLAVSNWPVINEAGTNLALDGTLCLGIQDQDCQANYVVQPGDYCDLIASKTGINSTMLMANNPQIDEACDNIYEGEVLCVAPTLLVTPAPEGFVMPGSSFESSATASTSASPVTTTSATAATTTSPAVAEDAAKATTTSSAAGADATDDADCDDGSDDDDSDNAAADDDEDDGSDCTDD